MWLPLLLSTGRYTGSIIPMLLTWSFGWEHKVMDPSCSCVDGPIWFLPTSIATIFKTINNPPPHIQYPSKLISINFVHAPPTHPPPPLHFTKNLGEDISNWTCTFAMCLWIGGDVCLFLLSDWYLEWFLAIAHIGGIVAPLNHRWVSSRILNYTSSVPKNIKRKICLNYKRGQKHVNVKLGLWVLTISAHGLLRFQLLPPFSVPPFHDQAEHRLLVQLLILNHNSFWVNLLQCISLSIIIAELRRS